MTYEDLIPTYRIGEKVRLRYRPYEMVCPVCGQPAAFAKEPCVKEVTILAKPGKIIVYPCDHVIPCPEGFYEVSEKSAVRPRFLAVPYTLLERIE